MISQEVAVKCQLGPQTSDGSTGAVGSAHSHGDKLLTGGPTLFLALWTSP